MDEVFKKRRATRRFSTREIEPEKLEEILEAANSAPSAGNLKAREIVVVKDKKLKERLGAAAWSQMFLSQAPVVLVFLSVPLRSAVKYGERGKELYALQDATISASFAWLQAVMVGLSACWVGAFDDEAVRRILQVKDGWRPIAILPIGYP